MCDPQVLTQVGDLLSTLRARITGFEVNVLRVRVVVRLLVSLVITVFAAVPVKKENFHKCNQFCKFTLNLMLTLAPLPPDKEYVRGCCQ